MKNDIVPQFINELTEAEEWKSVEELSKSYLKHKSNELVMDCLAMSYYKQQKYSEALEVLELIDRTDSYMWISNKTQCLYYLGRAPEAEQLIRTLPLESLDEEYLINLGLYMTSQGKYEKTKKLLKPIVNKSDKAAFNYGWHLMADDKLLEGYKLSLIHI